MFNKFSLYDLKTILIIVLAFFLITNIYNGCNEKKEFLNAVSSKDSQIIYYKNKFGVLKAEKQAIEVTLEEAKDLNLFKDLKIKKLKNLVGHTTVSTVTENTIVTNLDTIIVNDTLKNFSFDYKDNWLTLNGNISDSLRLKYTVIEDLDVTVFKKAPKLFKNKILMVNVSSKNPNSLITDIQTIQIKEPKKQFWETKGFAFALGFITYGIIK